MSDHPAKRRKTSPTTAASVDATAVSEASNITNVHTLQSPVTHRQSFQSPTRSSLARSNPEVLSHVLARSPIRSPQRQPTSRGNLERPFGIRDRKALRPSLPNAESSPLRQSPKRGSVSIQAAFAAPPRRVSRKIDSPVREQNDGGRADAQTTPINNSMEEFNPEEQLASELDSATRELEKTGLLSTSTLPEDFLEPELPPTPTQLGRVKIPGARQDHLSSPSAGKRLRNELQRSSVLGAAGGITLVEDDLDDPEAQKRKKVKRELLAQLDQLKTEVEQLEKWSDRAKTAPDKPQSDQEAVASLISILASTNRSTNKQSETPAPPISHLISSLLPFSAKAVSTETRSTSPEPINAFALHQITDPKPFMTAFASLSLEHSKNVSLSTSSETAITETHEITLSASLPFPQNQFRVPISFKTELQSQRIMSVSLPKNPRVSSSSMAAGKQSKIPPSLQTWIESRISSPILALDISGLCVGINRYWEASICRARIWARLKKSQQLLLAAKEKGPKNLHDIHAENLTGPLKKSDLRAVVPHLQRSSMLFSYHSSPSMNKNNSNSKTKRTRLLLSCPLSLDQWTSEAQLKPDISISMPDLTELTRNRVELDLKRLFHNVLKQEGKIEMHSMSSSSSSTDLTEERKAQAIVKAAEGVLGVLFGLDVL